MSSTNQSESSRTTKVWEPLHSYTEAQLQAILDTSVEGIITIDRRGIVESFNRSAERMFGYAADEVIGHNVSMLMPSPDREQHDENLGRYLASGKKNIIGIGRDTYAKRRDGTLFSVHLSVSEVRVSGRIIFTGFVHDITELRDSQQKLVQSERLAAIGEAMTGLAHESRNALQRIQVCTEMLFDLLPEDDADAEEYIRVIQSAQDDLHRIHQEVRDYAAPIVLDRTLNALPEIVRTAWTQTAVDRASREIKWSESSSCDASMCEVDADAMVRVFRNILENALAADTGPLTIEVRYERMTKSLSHY